MVEGNDYWIDDDESIFALSIFFFAAVPGSDGSNDNENVSIDVYLDAFLHPPSPLSPSNSSSSPTCLRWTFSPPPQSCCLFYLFSDLLPLFNPQQVVVGSLATSSFPSSFAYKLNERNKDRKKERQRKKEIKKDRKKERKKERRKERN